jgi:hypothetical protein
MLYFVGIDYSITSPSVSILDSDSNVTTSHFLSSKKKLIGNHSTNNPLFQLVGHEYPDWQNDEQRHLLLSDWALSLLPDDSVQIWIEGYSFGSTGSRLFQIAENTGCLKQNLHSHNYAFNTVPPTSIKKFATDKGNANKALMISTFKEKTGINIPLIIGLKDGHEGSPVSDIVDSYFIAQYAESQYPETLVL